MAEELDNCSDNYTASQHEWSEANSQNSKAQRIDYISQPVSELEGQLKVMGDKSISHRALLLGSLAQGKTRIHNCLMAKDILATVQVLQQLGIEIEQEDNCITILGNGKQGYKTPKETLDFGNSGTSLRLMTSILAGQGIASRLIGDESLSLRPMARIIKPLIAMGARIQAAENDTPPLMVHPIAVTKPIDYRLPMASAQVKSALLLAGLYTKGVTLITEPLPTRDHTERMLRCFGVELGSQSGKISLYGEQELKSTELYIPADLSSAAFFIVGACISKHACLTLRQVGINPSRLGIIHLLRRMGAKLQLHNISWFNNEPIADITVQASELTAISVNADEVALAVDELPIFCIAAACAMGKTKITGATELRYKESDRIKAMVTGLTNLGIKAEEISDGLTIEGGSLQGGVVDSVGDHRIAMAFSMAAAAATQAIRVLNCANVATSLPNFMKLANQIGFNILSVSEEAAMISASTI